MKHPSTIARYATLAVLICLLSCSSSNQSTQETPDAASGDASNANNNMNNSDNESDARQDSADAPAEEDTMNQDADRDGGAPRFLALGDSYTIGESVPESERWPVQLAATLRAGGVEVADPEIIAVTGWTTSDLDAGIDREGPEGPYAMVSLLIGVNNQYRGRDLEEYRTQYRALLGRAIGFAGGSASHVFVVSIPDWGVMPFAEGRDRAAIGLEIDAFNAICKEETEAMGVPFIDITPISREATDDPELAAGDGLHPSGKQYGRWVEIIAPVARQILATE